MTLDVSLEPAAPLLARLAGLRERTAALVEHRSAGDPTATDPLRGLYLSEEAVRHLLSPAPAPAELPSLDEDFPDRLAELGTRLRLTHLDTAILLIALAPDLDRTFEPLYGYLNDDVGRRRATTGLALDLYGVPAHLAVARARFHPTAPLAALGLLTVEEPERPFLSRSLRVPDRVLSHLLGDDTPSAALTATLRDVSPTGRPHGGSPAGSPPDGGSAPDRMPADDRALGGSSPEGAFADGDFVRRLAGRIAAGPLFAYLRERQEGEGQGCAVLASRLAGVDAWRCSVTGEEQVPELLREARLSGRALVVEAGGDPAPLVRALGAAGDVTVLLTAARPYDPQWCDHRDPLVLEVPSRRATALDAWSAALPADPGFDLAATVAPYHLGGDRLARAARAAQDLAAFDGTPLAAGHVRLAARQQSASGLEQHARRIRPAVDWRDLVLPERPLTELRELASRARHRDRVLGDWRLSAGGGRGRGVLGLFAGESGTGKTLSAEVVAAELGLDLYVVQLSSVVDKYVGETEKNLERIFSEADRTDAVLLFDEADAVFGKRSEVKDAHDRYANLESAYLLQRLEAFNGIALLTTNLRANIDEAFTRRLDLVIDFPFPDEEQRLALWRHGLAHVPSTGETELRPLARDFELAGGSIRSAVVTAAYLAAARAEPVTAADLLEGARREYRKAGRLVPGAW
ncbi:ATP-binding protein [Streptomyces humi]|uniref:ATP-binding protein n=1 Tax=Streptomyces humi TaxID=1428620 RepID=UPI0006287165|nr:ATP-binding protein [Streptomyces humi]